MQTPTLKQRIHAFLHPFNALNMALLAPVPLEVSRSPQPHIPPLNPNVPSANFEAYFSPHGGAAEALAREIRKADSLLRVQAYQLTHPDIQAAIHEVVSKGVKTEIILDKTQQQYPFAGEMQALGASVFDDHTVKIAHNKVVLIESKIDLTDPQAVLDCQEPHYAKYLASLKQTATVQQVLVNGTFNFTANAEESNAENMVIWRIFGRPELKVVYDAFTQSFETRRNASLVWGTEHPPKTLGLDFELESPEERNERLNG